MTQEVPQRRQPPLSVRVDANPRAVMREPLTRARVQSVAQAVAQELEAQEDDCERCRREEDGPGCRKHRAVTIKDHVSPVSQRWANPNSDEGKGCFKEDRRGDTKRKRYDYRAQCMRKHVMDNYP